MSKTAYRLMQGFTLIEVLVSMVILAIGLLGLGILQGRALKSNQDAFLYGQANLLAYEMADRIKANWAYWGVQPSGSINTVPTAALPSGQTSTNACSTTTSGGLQCTATQLAAYDMYYWQQSVTAILGNGVNTPTTSIARVTSGTATTACPYNDQTSLCIKITWTRADTNISGLTTATQTLGVTP